MNDKFVKLRIFEWIKMTIKIGYRSTVDGKRSRQKELKTNWVLN